ncbi:hypothetical protein AS361_02495 [Myroides marinus]|uniref:hypothetical protein n=1 Tax=Myroides marinus TaxID=703342 RepID=UPI000741B684|nr:hypothetical protein [Myroides marinus]KUF39468.1 hypothetical protein AS361_02495 [Myroides marinus]
MNKLLVLTIGLLLGSNVAFAQLFAVVDTRGSVDIRKEADGKSGVIRQLSSGDIVYIAKDSYNKNAEWQNVSLSDEKIGPRGYIQTSKLKELSSFEKVSLNKQSYSNLIFEGNGIRTEMNIEEVNFQENRTNFVPQYKGANDTYSLIAYKNKEAFGIEGLHKLRNYSSIVVNKHGHAIELPSTSFENMFSPNQGLRSHCTFDRENNVVYIFTTNGDAAGTYTVAWIIKNNEYFGRFITKKPL